MKLLLGTGLIVDFPTLKANIYPKRVVEPLLNSAKLKKQLADGLIAGGIMDGAKLRPKNNLITHIVTDIRLYKDEIVTEIETVDSPQVKKALAAIKKKKANLILHLPESYIGEGIIVRKIYGVKCVHITEDVLPEIQS